MSMSWDYNRRALLGDAEIAKIAEIAKRNEE